MDRKGTKTVEVIHDEDGFDVLVHCGCSCEFWVSPDHNVELVGQELLPVCPRCKEVRRWAEAQEET